MNLSSHSIHLLTKPSTDAYIYSIRATACLKNQTPQPQVKKKIQKADPWLRERVLSNTTDRKYQVTRAKRVPSWATATDYLAHLFPYSKYIASIPSHPLCLREKNKKKRRSSLRKKVDHGEDLDSDPGSVEYLERGRRSPELPPCVPRGGSKRYSSVKT